MRYLVISHAHPDFSVGGAEIAAFNLFTSLRDDSSTDSATFLARSDSKFLAPGTISMRRPGEYLWRQDMGDWFKLATAYPQSITRNFRDFLKRFKPDTVYVHHYAHIGIEMLREIRKTLPNCRLIVTLHEYMAICNHQGQMVKTDATRRLCYQSSPEECSGCFPSISPENFWLRRQYLEQHVSVVDMFVSPSYFLRDRYIAWGLAPEKIVVIENGQPTEVARYPTPSATKALTTIGFFGQITAYKGVDLLLQGFSIVPREQRTRLLLEIHGANLEQQTEAFQLRIKELAEPLIKEGSLRWVGAYQRNELMRRMAGVDWVVVPSIWWENSPMVIQEAFVCGKPVICSDIGGMAEKVRDHVTGRHFEARNPHSLAAVLTSLSASGGELASKGELKSVSYAQSAMQYKTLAHAA